MDKSVTRVVNKPAEEVFDFFSDAANNPKWQEGMVSCHWLDDGPIGVGSRYEQRAKFMGRDIVSVFEVTRFQPNHLIRIDTIESTFPISVTRTVEPMGDGRSKVHAHIRGGPQSGPLKWLEPLINRRAEKSIESDYDRLVQLLES